MQAPQRKNTVPAPSSETHISILAQIPASFARRAHGRPCELEHATQMASTTPEKPVGWVAEFLWHGAFQPEGAEAATHEDQACAFVHQRAWRPSGWEEAFAHNAEGAAAHHMSARALSLVLVLWLRSSLARRGSPGLARESARSPSTAEARGIGA